MKRVELGTVRPVAKIRIIGALCAYEQVPWGHKARADGVFFRPVGLGQREGAIKAKWISNWEKRVSKGIQTCGWDRIEEWQEVMCGWIPGRWGWKRRAFGTCSVAVWFYWGFETEEGHRSVLWKYDSDILEEDGLEMKETRNKGPLKDLTIVR